MVGLEKPVPLTIIRRSGNNITGQTQINVQIDAQAFDSHFLPDSSIVRNISANMLLVPDDCTVLAFS
jgi:hypothetical protein